MKWTENLKKLNEYNSTLVHFNSNHCVVILGSTNRRGGGIDDVAELIPKLLDELEYTGLAADDDDDVKAGSAKLIAVN